MMASATFIKDTGCTGMLYVLLFGLLLPSVSALTTMSPSSSTTASMSTAAPTTTMSTAAPTTTMSTAAPTVSMSTAAPTASMSTAAATTTGTTQSPTVMTTTATPAASTNAQPPATTSGPTTTVQSIAVSAATPTAQPAGSTTVGGTTISSTTQSPTPTATSGASTMSGPASSSSSSSSSSMTSNSGPWTSMMSTTPSSNSTCGMTGMNGTTMMYCPSFTCNYTDCYTMYTSQNTTLCADGVCLCQLIKQTDMCYTVGCSLSCADSCVNASQTNCSVSCCNSTGCLNSSFASMMMNTTTVMPTTSTKATMQTTILPTTANKGNKCHIGSCTGTDCYTTFQTAQTCTSSQPHCQLKKETEGSGLRWTAGCTTNCSYQTPCKVSTLPPCHLECCNATMTSCLRLNGTLNVPNFSTRGPHLNTELVASLFCLLAITLLL